MQKGHRSHSLCQPGGPRSRLERRGRRRLPQRPAAVTLATLGAQVLHRARRGACGNSVCTLVPPVWIEQTTCRLQGGCSTTELSRHGGWSAECKSSARALKTHRRPGPAPQRRHAFLGLLGARPAGFPPGKRRLMQVGRNCANYVLSASAGRGTLVPNNRQRPAGGGVPCSA